MGNYNLDTFLSTVIAMLTGVGGKLIFALMVITANGIQAPAVRVIADK